MTTATKTIATKRPTDGKPDAKASIKAVNILLVDDHPVVRKGLVAMIEAERGMKVIAEAGDAREAMSGIAEHKPDLAIVDLTLKDIGGLELIKQIKASHPGMPVLVLSMHDEKIYAERALKAGASGYIMKQELTERLITAIRTVMRGEIYLSEKMASRILGKMVGGRRDDETTPMDRLSDRELEVFELLGRGLNTREIAKRLCLSVKTVETHREHIKEKLQIRDATKLIQQATHWVINECQPQQAAPQV